MTNLNGKRVLLTGGSQGLGPVIAEALARSGASHIALAARTEAPLSDVARSLRKLGVEAIAVPVDLTQAKERQKLVSTVLEKFKVINVLVNNAGIETEGAFLGRTLDDIHETIEVNLVAPIDLTHLVLLKMSKKDTIHIVNISSVGAKSGAPFSATYCGTKAGLAEWTRGLRLELAGTKVYFSTIFPGYVTDVGIFAKYGLRPPWTIGSCTSSQVARAVVHAIQHRKQEVIVNSRPLRPAFALAELFPALGDWLMHRLGVVDLQYMKAKIWKESVKK